MVVGAGAGAGTVVVAAGADVTTCGSAVVGAAAGAAVDGGATHVPLSHVLLPPATLAQCTSAVHRGLAAQSQREGGVLGNAGSARRRQASV